MQPQNSFTNFLALTDVLNDDDLYEVRVENDMSGKILYLGRSITPNAPTDEPIWYIKKLYYDGNGFLVRVQIPDNGVGFEYIWDDRATYFT